MNLVPVAIGRTVARNALLVQRSSPGLLLGAGIAGMVGTTVLACRATLKMETLLEEAEIKLNGAMGYQNPEYSDSDRERDIKLIRAQTRIRIVKLYAPAVILGGISIVALTQSHSILTRRNAALAAAYGALEKGFSEYRSRVVEKYGEEEDQHLRYGSEKVEVLDEDTGKPKMITRVAPGDPSVYAKFFDDSSPSWESDPEINKLFLKCQQNHANDKLRANGHLFLNEVYDSLGIPRTKAGSVVGWVLSQNGSTDNFVNFGIFDGSSSIARDFVNGREGAILLDFNVDGLIYEMLEN